MLQGIGIHLFYLPELPLESQSRNYPNTDPLCAVWLQAFACLCRSTNIVRFLKRMGEPCSLSPFPPQAGTFAGSDTLRTCQAGWNNSFAVLCGQVYYWPPALRGTSGRHNTLSLFPLPIHGRSPCRLSDPWAVGAQNGWRIHGMPKQAVPWSRGGACRFGQAPLSRICYVVSSLKAE